MGNTIGDQENQHKSVHDSTKKNYDEERKDEENNKIQVDSEPNDCNKFCKC